RTLKSRKTANAAMRVTDRNFSWCERVITSKAASPSSTTAAAANRIRPIVVLLTLLSIVAGALERVQRLDPSRPRAARGALSLLRDVKHVAVEILVAVVNGGFWPAGCDERPHLMLVVMPSQEVLGTGLKRP